MGFISLKTKFVALCVLFSTGTAGILGCYLVLKSYEALRTQAQQAQLSLAKTLAWEVDQGISRAFQAIEDLAQRPEVSEMKDASIRRELAFVTSTTELLDGLLVVSNDGRVIAYNHPGVLSEDLPPANWFRENMSKINNLVGSVLVDFYKTPSGNVGVVIAAPIHGRRGGKRVGILAGILYIPNHTIGNLEDVHLGKTGYVYLVNEDGTAIIHPDRTMRLTDLSKNPSVQALHGREEGVLQYRNKNGEEILSAFSRIASSGWGIVVHQPADECYEPAYKMLKVMSAFLFLTVVLIAALSALVAGRVVQPLLTLARRVEKIDWGGFGPIRPGDSPPRDEVGLLDRSISRMVLRLETQKREQERAHQRALEAEKKLSESGKLAAIGQLAASLAHELNNPLGVIYGTAQLAAGREGRRLRKWAQRIVAESDRCRKLVFDLLDFARPLKLKPRKTDLARLAVSCWGQLNPVPGGGPLRLKISPNTFSARVDPDRFKQVFLNLMVNAVQAMPAGGALQIRFQRAKGMGLAFFEDEGGGIPPGNLEKIFQPFFTTKTRGTGLGLPIARSILQAHGGTIRARPSIQGARLALKWPEHQRKENRNGA